MKQHIREQLEKRKEELQMAEGTLNITPEQLQKMLADAVTAGVNAAKGMNPLEQKVYDEQMTRERNKIVFRDMVRAEQQREANKKLNCTHMRYPANAGKMAGHMAPKGQGEWMTGAQMHHNGLATVICQRCGSDWHFKPSADEVAYIIDGGGSGFPPPDASRWIKNENMAIA